MNGKTLSGRNVKAPDRNGTKDYNMKGAEPILSLAKRDKKKMDKKAAVEQAKMGKEQKPIRKRSQEMPSS